MGRSVPGRGASGFLPAGILSRGVAPLLVAAAIAEAGKHGATLVESYPVAEDAPSYRFMGFVPMFAKAGFEKVGTAGTRRTVMRKTIPSP